MYFVPVSRKITLEPLYYLGKGLSLFRFDDEMDMIIHNTEVQKLERILLFSFFDVGQEHSLDPRQFKVSLSGSSSRKQEGLVLAAYNGRRIVLLWA